MHRSTPLPGRPIPTAGRHNRIIFGFLLLWLTACGNRIDPFYRTSHTEDIDVLPLIKPYRLWSPVPGNTTWHMDLKQTGAGRSQVNASSINVVKQTIYGRDRGDFFVIVLDEHLEKIFNDATAWSAYLKARGINSDELYDVLEVYTAFDHKDHTLPWQLPAQQP